MGISVGFFTETAGSLRNPETRRNPSYLYILYYLIIYRVHQNTYPCNNCWFPVKLTPGTGKRGKACKTALNIFIMDKSTIARHSFIHSFIHIFIHSFIHLLIYSFIHSFIHIFIHAFIFLFIN